MEGRKLTRGDRIATWVMGALGALALFAFSFWV